MKSQEHATYGSTKTVSIRADFLYIYPNTNYYKCHINLTKLILHFKLHKKIQFYKMQKKTNNADIQVRFLNEEKCMLTLTINTHIGNLD